MDLPTINGKRLASIDSVQLRSAGCTENSFSISPFLSSLLRYRKGCGHTDWQKYSKLMVMVRVLSRYKNADAVCLNSSSKDLKRSSLKEKVVGNGGECGIIMATEDFQLSEQRKRIESPIKFIENLPVAYYLYAIDATIQDVSILIIFSLARPKTTLRTALAKAGESCVTGKYFLPHASTGPDNRAGVVRSPFQEPKC